MTRSHDSELPADLIHVVERLASEKPELSALELDAVKQRVRKKAARKASAPRQKGIVVKSRLAITSMLVVGVLLSAMGGAGIADQTSASSVEYGRAVPTPIAPPTVAGQVQSAPAPAPTLVPEAAPTVAGEVAEGGVAPAREADPASDVEPAAQVAADADERLPFTGFAAIPVLLGGLALLATGLVLRRRMPQGL